MSRLSLYLLGPPLIEKDGVPVEVDRRKPLALIAYLAITGERCSRDGLAGLLWPEYDQTRARASLRRDLSILNKVLGQGWLKVEREAVGLNRNADLWLDVDEFRRHLSECRAHGHPQAEACPECVKPLAEAVRLYRGDLLAGFSLQDSVVFDDWQFSKTQELHGEMLSALERLVSWQGRRGELESAIGTLRRWLTMDRTNEVAHRHLMESYARTGQRAAALRQYEECVRVLEKELGESPQEETIKLYEAIKGNRISAGKALPFKPLDTRCNNLPVQLTSFIGREREMAEVKRLLTTARLLTLTGAGGCGKTRLALKVAADLVEAYPDGVWLVEMAPLSDPALVPQKVASALDVREQPGRPMLAALSDYLKPRRLLLILDNCEHLTQACSRLSEGLLRACPKLQVLVTSREALGIAGETVWRVPSLSSPDPRHLPPVENLTMYEAVRLLIDRALAVQPTFTATNRNAPAVAQICHRLDGIPLAIELAAARAKVLSVDQIAARLDDSFRLLTGGSRTALPRHQTLKATMDWSYSLLSEAEQVTLRRLSAFSGGWTLAAAEAVCAGEGIEAYEVLDLLTHLVDKSLVVAEEQDGKVRYRLLETVRQYAHDKLLESGEKADLCRRHLNWFLDLAERAEPELRGPDQGMWFGRLEAEHDNLRTALQWSDLALSQSPEPLQGKLHEGASEGTEEGSAQGGLRLAGALWLFWSVRGYWSEGLGWLERALSRDSGASSFARAKALIGAGALAWGQGDLERAAALCEECLNLSRELSYRQGVVWSLILSGFLDLTQGDHGRARALCEENLALCREAGDKWGTAWLLIILGLATRDQGDPKRARALLEEGLALFREVGNKHGMAWSLNHLGFLAIVQGDHERAAVLCEEELALFQELGDKWGVAASLGDLGLVARDQGDYARARALYNESLSLWQKLGNKANIVRCLEGLAGIAGAEGHLERAARLFGAAEALRQAIGVPLPSSDRAGYDRSIATVRAGLGEEASVAVLAEGRKMTTEEAIAYAMS